MVGTDENYIRLESRLTPAFQGPNFERLRPLIVIFATTLSPLTPFLMYWNLQGHLTQLWSIISFLGDNKYETA